MASSLTLLLLLANNVFYEWYLRFDEQECAKIRQFLLQTRPRPWDIGSRKCLRVVFKVAGGCALGPVRMLRRDGTERWNFPDAIRCVITKLRQQQRSVHWTPPLFRSQERPVTGQQLVQCVYTTH
ncbi:hypothetical protein T10_5865 [Trichinella papuae]|uniref:Secreted protein n=1 Tax=Trichinella papuae TaxID=268474 RepID=A0A0V1M1B8_9BILA|nr:hypothetical protein T10_10480 [Trichinella papuae]KRZ65788.1 hypothetical protein T10_5865 [Trichinella papuae]